MRFFFDNCISPHLAIAIHSLEQGQTRHHVEPLRARFDPATRDIEWITALGTDEHEWVVLSGDLRISRNEAERRAWKESGLTMFFMQHSWASQTEWLYASRLIQRWPEILLRAARSRRQQGIVVPFKGDTWERILL